MNSKDQRSAKSNHLVILLSVLGLVAFSSAVKDLSQLHQYALEAGDLISSWSYKAPPVEIPTAVVKVETCELGKTLEQSVPSVELPWLENAAKMETMVETKVEVARVTERAKRNRVRPARIPRIDFDPVQLEVRVPSDAETEVMIPMEFPQFTFKTKTRKPNVIRVNPRDREMILKTLNRSINLRIAS